MSERTVHIVEATCGEYEPDGWLVCAFESKDEAERFAKDYNDRAEAVENEILEYQANHDEPEGDSDWAFDAWHEWMMGQEAIRRKHPDERYSNQAERTHYFVRELEFRALSAGGQFLMPWLCWKYGHVPTLLHGLRRCRRCNQLLPKGGTTDG